jgi:hypothetical protein
VGLQMKDVQDLTREVIPTWDICRRRGRVVSPFKMLFPQVARDFTRVIDLMLCALRGGALSYTVMVAERPCRQASETFCQISSRAIPDQLAAGIEDV